MNTGCPVGINSEGFLPMLCWTSTKSSWYVQNFKYQLPGDRPLKQSLFSLPDSCAPSSHLHHTEGPVHTSACWSLPAICMCMWRCILSSTSAWAHLPEAEDVRPLRGPWRQEWEEAERKGFDCFQLERGFLNPLSTASWDQDKTFPWGNSQDTPEGHSLSCCDFEAYGLCTDRPGSST